MFSVDTKTENYNYKSLKKNKKLHILEQLISFIIHFNGNILETH